MPSTGYRHPDPAPTNLDRLDSEEAFRAITEWARTVVDASTGDLRPHADTHAPNNSADPLATAAPSVDVGADPPEEGTLGTLLRSDAKFRLGIGTTKGDLLVFDGTQWQRLPVSTNAYVLTLDAAEALGVKWAVGGSSLVPLTTVLLGEPEFVWDDDLNLVMAEGG